MILKFGPGSAGGSGMKEMDFEQQIYDKHLLNGRIKYDIYFPGDNDLLKIGSPSSSCGPGSQFREFEETLATLFLPSSNPLLAQNHPSENRICRPSPTGVKPVSK